MKESIRMMFHQIENINKKIEFICKKKSQIEILELKSTITKILKFIRGVQQQI